MHRAEWLFLTRRACLHTLFAHPFVTCFIFASHSIFIFHYTVHSASSRNHAFKFRNVCVLRWAWFNMRGWRWWYLRWCFIGLSMWVPRRCNRQRNGWGGSTWRRIPIRCHGIAAATLRIRPARTSFLGRLLFYGSIGFHFLSLGFAALWHNDISFRHLVRPACVQ